MFAVGEVVGSYRILAPLRSGGMADLFLAQREGAAGFRRLVAIKVVHPQQAEEPHAVRMFLDEARLTARIDHPNVVHVEDLGQAGTSYFLVMEYVHGASLSQLLRALAKLRRRLSPSVAVAIASRVAEGLHAAHETTDDQGKLVNLVHRDVSPPNILLSHKGHVKLIDFGVAKAALRTEHTTVATLKGKVRYMAPEQATTGQVDRRSDIYSLGIVLWEMLTMRRLFDGASEFDILMKVRNPKVEPPSTHVHDLPEELDRVVMAALHPDPEARPKTARDFRRAMAKALPRAMALDSAHLAELLASVAGDELEDSRNEFPKDVSTALHAEQLRAAVFGGGDAAAERRATRAVEVMTERSQEPPSFDDEDTSGDCAEPGLDVTAPRGLRIARPVTPVTPDDSGGFDEADDDDSPPTRVANVAKAVRERLLREADMPAPPARSSSGRRLALVLAVLAALVLIGVGGALLWPIFMGAAVSPLEPADGGLAIAAPAADAGVLAAADAYVAPIANVAPRAIDSGAQGIEAPALEEDAGAPRRARPRGRWRRRR